jgi:hypothetical protein
MTGSDNPLKLIALDEEDLEIISAHCQDAVVRPVEMAFVKNARRFALIINRFDWETALESPKSKSYRRRRAALRFECVNSAQRLKLSLDKKSDAIKLLAIRFKESTAPAGEVNLIFSGGAEIKLDVECIEAELQDLGAIWETSTLPDHKLEE